MRTKILKEQKKVRRDLQALLSMVSILVGGDGGVWWWCSGGVVIFCLLYFFFR
jgi:hypothetical protein